MHRPEIVVRRPRLLRRRPAPMTAGADATIRRTPSATVRRAAFPDRARANGHITHLSKKSQIAACCLLTHCHNRDQSMDVRANGMRHASRSSYGSVCARGYFVAAAGFTLTMRCDRAFERLPENGRDLVFPRESLEEPTAQTAAVPERRMEHRWLASSSSKRTIPTTSAIRVWHTRANLEAGKPVSSRAIRRSRYDGLRATQPRNVNPA
jgi:hypothetical protein